MEATLTLKDEEPGVFASFVFLIIYNVIHTVYSTIYNIKQALLHLAKSSYQQFMEPKDIETKYTKLGKDLESFKNTLGKLAKIPKHIAFSIMPEKYINSEIINESLKKDNNNLKKGSNNKIDLGVAKSLAREISWAYVANINVISLYDHHGLLKTSHDILKDQVLGAIQQNINGFLKIASNEIKSQAMEIPNIKIFNADEHVKLLDLDDEIKQNNSPTIYICIFSYDSGKDGVVETIKEVVEKEAAKAALKDNTVNNHEAYTFLLQQKYKIESMNIINSLIEKQDKTSPQISNNNSRRSSINSLNNDNNNNSMKSSENPDVPNENKMDSLINEHTYKVWNSKKLPYEPEVLIVHGDVTSTLGFLPWHIRLTEFFWQPELFNMELNDFTNVLVKYGKCHQKFGA